MIILGTTGWRRSTEGVRLFHPLFSSRLAQPGDEIFLFYGGFWVGLFCGLFGFVGFCFVFWFWIVSFPFLHTKAVESFKSQWKDTGLTPGLVGAPSVFTTAGILEICCSLRGKKWSADQRTTCCTHSLHHSHSHPTNRGLNVLGMHCWVMIQVPDLKKLMLNASQRKEI